MKIKEITDYLCMLFPLSLQEDYDNSGLQVGDLSQDLTGVLIALDGTMAVLDEALNTHCNLLILHHPILFQSIKRIGVDSDTERFLQKAIKNDVVVFAMHTNLDNHIDGVNCKFAEKIGLENIKILVPKGHLLYKLSIYTPAESVNLVHTAVCEAGAGGIGNYYDCSFYSEGTATFTANEKANPAVGQIGVAENKKETKMEYVVERHLMDGVLQAMSSAHPYEEVAHEIIAIENKHQQRGSGMIGDLNTEMDELEFLNLLKKTFGCGVVKYTALMKKPIRKVAICGGSGRFLLEEARAQQADVFVSSDFKYHDYFAAENQILIADIGHYETEQFTSELLVDIIKEKFPTFAIRITELNTNPVNYL